MMPYLACSLILMIQAVVENVLELTRNMIKYYAAISKDARIMRMSVIGMKKLTDAVLKFLQELWERNLKLMKLVIRNALLFMNILFGELVEIIGIALLIVIVWTRLMILMIIATLLEILGFIIILLES